MSSPHRIISGSVFKVEDSPDDFVKETIIKIINHSEAKSICKLLKEKLPHLEELIKIKEGE